MRSTPPTPRRSSRGCTKRRRGLVTRRSNPNPNPKLELQYEEATRSRHTQVSTPLQPDEAPQLPSRPHHVPITSPITSQSRPHHVPITSPSRPHRLPMVFPAGLSTAPSGGGAAARSRERGGGARHDPPDRRSGRRDAAAQLCRGARRASGGGCPQVRGFAASAAEEHERAAALASCTAWSAAGSSIGSSSGSSTSNSRWPRATVRRRHRRLATTRQARRAESSGTMPGERLRAQRALDT